MDSSPIQSSAIHATRLYIPIAKARGIEAEFDKILRRLTMPIHYNVDSVLERVFIYRVIAAWRWDELMIAFQEEIRFSKGIAPGHTYDTIVDARVAEIWGQGVMLPHFRMMLSANP